jgi:transposase
MFLPSSVKIFMSDRPVDMRKGFDGLIAIVRSIWREDVFSGHLFVFLGAKKDRAKVLYWDHGGFVMYYKRLEKGRFKSPTIPDDRQAIELNATQLYMLLDGIDFERVAQKKRWLPKKSS